MREPERESARKTPCDPIPRPLPPFVRDKAAYLAYRARTSPVIPLPPALYAVLPLIIKRTLLLELPMYETDWNWSPTSKGQEGATAVVAAPLTNVSTSADPLREGLAPQGYQQ